MRRLLLAGCMSAALLGGSYTIVNAETTTLLAAMSVQPDMRRTIIIDTFIGALKAAGVWSKIDVMWVFAAHDEQAARINWKSPGNFTCAVINSPVFTPNIGYAGDGVSGYLDPSWVKSTHAVQFTLNDAHIFTYQRTEASTIGTIGQAGLTRISAGGGVTLGERSGCAVNSFTVVSLAGGTMPQLTLGRRNDASNASLIRDGVEVVAPSAAVSTDTSAAVPVVFFRRNAGYTPAQSAGGGWGAYLNDTQAAAHYAAWHDYMVAVGADT